MAATIREQRRGRAWLAGVDAGASKVLKSRRTSELSIERMELGHVRVGAALHQVDRWVEQWDRMQSRSSSRHLRVSTPACSNEERRRQGVWSRQQLLDNGHTIWPEEEWVGLIQQATARYGYGYANSRSMQKVIRSLIEARCLGSGGHWCPGGSTPGFVLGYTTGGW